MSYPRMMGETVKIVPGVSHGLMNAIVHADSVSLESYAKVGVLVSQYQTAGGAAAITVNAWTGPATGTEKTGVTIANWWHRIDTTPGTTADTWTKGASAASITTSNTASATSYYWLEFDADELRTVNSSVDYKFIEVEVGSGGQAGNFLNVIYFLFGPRYAGSTLPSAQS